MNNYYYYLMHGGPGSGRYPLGSGNRPYQKYETSKRKGSLLRTEKRVEKKVQKQKDKELKERANKERILREGTAAEVMKYQGKITNQELQNAFTRLNLESQIRNISRNESLINRLMRNIKTDTEWVKTGIDAYNTIASIYNFINPDAKEKPLTFIATSNKKK